MPFPLSFPPSLLLSIIPWQSVRPFVCIFVSLYGIVSARLPVIHFVRPFCSVSLSVCLSVYVYLSMCLSVCLSASLVCLPNHIIARLSYSLSLSFSVSFVFLSCRCASHPSCCDDGGAVGAHAFCRLHS